MSERVIFQTKSLHLSCRNRGTNRAERDRSKLSACKKGTVILMAKIEQPNTVCKSVFKSGENTTTRDEFTKKWIELINRLERSKSVNFCEKQ